MCDVEPSDIFLMHTADPSTILGTTILTYDVESITVLYHTLLSTSPGHNSKAGTYGLHIGTVKFTNV